MGDGAEIGLPDELGVFGEEPALVTRCRRPPSGTTRIELLQLLSIPSLKTAG